jgi:hypothetical protein
MRTLINKRSEINRRKPRILPRIRCAFKLFFSDTNIGKSFINDADLHKYLAAKTDDHMFI